MQSIYAIFIIMKIFVNKWTKNLKLKNVIIFNIDIIITIEVKFVFI
jgi:hypothetical protein